jgi:hypothetical protein
MPYLASSLSPSYLTSFSAYAVAIFAAISADFVCIISASF